ncbi:murein biosynthesis integral membrane protein MurJ [Helicobacter sp. 16-1353]|uniref:murein biosynthesis integral membrane protein MurJ n=1 Tax=Helicobacter sp. 16-1353 TaxID=2004996 RepID=UPI000DCCE3A4|nr:murein biosynthesis integral membrane protein MurJ [Helicobacter sp. 16-1353]RAX54235.1 murein biosynthesis integral membrane protein MurJ [Helicobacter sp. 16-1353]
MFKKAFFTNSSGILCSRIFGFIRDLSMASTLGAGIYSDIFFIAFKLPNLFRRIFSEGAFTQSFLPSFIGANRKGLFTVTVFLIFFSFLIIFSICVWIFSGFFTKLLAYGFDDSIIALAKPIVAINFWYLCLIFCVNFFSSLLQYKNNFWVSAYNTTLLNISMILALFIARDKDSYTIVYFLSYGVLIGGILQILLHCYSLYKLRYFKLFIVGFKDLYRILSDKNQFVLNTLKHSLGGFFRQFFPALLGSSTAQIASFIDTLLASFLVSGSVSYLYYANRIFQLPLALFAIATSTALFPMIAKMIKNNNEEKAIALLKKGFWLLLFSLGFCVIGGIVLKNEIIWLLFERGKFIRSDTIIVANVFMAYLIGLLPFGLARIFSLWLYSFKRQTQAAKISAISLFCGVIFSLILMKPFGAVGLAIASSLGGFILFILTIRAFGFMRFINIINNKKLFILFIILLLLEFIILYFLKHFFNLGDFYAHL